MIDRPRLTALIALLFCSSCDRSGLPLEASSVDAAVDFTPIFLQEDFAIAADLATPPDLAPSLAFGLGVTTQLQGTQPGFLAVADFNRDQRLDLVVASQQQLQMPNIQVLLGDAKGAFPSSITTDTASALLWPAVADFNGDNKPDVAFLESSGRDVGLLIGRGNGGFKPPAAFSTQLQVASDIAIADFNKDGHVDIAAAAGTKLVIVPGVGDGTLISARQITAPCGDLRVGDVDGDRNPDVVCRESVANGNPTRLTALLGDGMGNFRLGSTVDAVQSVGDWAVSDFDNDGRADIIIGDVRAKAIEIFRSLADGTFAAVVTSPTAMRPGNVIIADFNGDRLPDIYTDFLSGVSLEAIILVGDGLNKVTEALRFPLEPVPGAGAGTVVGDFNNDGKPDIAVANLFKNDVTVYLNLTH